MQTTKIDRSREWTVDDYLMLGEMNTPCQLINGELIMSPSPTPLHQRVLRTLFKRLDASIPDGGEVFFAPLDLYVDAKNVLQPDLIYISKEKKNIISQRGVEGAPDIIVEIISPSNVFTDRNTRKTIYKRIGVVEYWIIDPANKTLEIYLHDQPNPDVPHLYLAGEGKVTSVVLPSLEFDLKTVF